MNVCKCSHSRQAYLGDTSSIINESLSTGASLAQSAPAITASINSIAGSAAASGGIGGAVLGGLTAAAPYLAVAALAAMPVENLFSCGTVSRIGCNKRTQANAQNAVGKDILKLANTYAGGQITESGYESGLSQLSTEFQQASAQVGRDAAGGYKPFNSSVTWRGLGAQCSFSAGEGVSHGSPAYQYLCGGIAPQQITSTMGQIQYAQGFPQWLGSQKVNPSAGKSNVLLGGTPASSAAASAPSASSGSGMLLLGLAAAAAFLLL